MFRTPAVEPAPIEVGTRVPTDLIPISVLGLDLPQPADGWLIELGRRGVKIEIDRIGRSSISSDAARALIAEHNANEARKRELAAENERQAIERDRQFRAQLSPGVSWLDMPPGVLPAAAMLAADEDSRVSVREQLLQQELAHLSRNGADS